MELMALQTVQRLSTFLLHRQLVRCQVVSIILEITVQFADNPVNSRKLSTLYTDSITKGTDVANVGQQWNGMLNSIPDAVSYIDTQVFFD